MFPRYCSLSFLFLKQQKKTCKNFHYFSLLGMVNVFIVRLPLKGGFYLSVCRITSIYMLFISVVYQ